MRATRQQQARDHLLWLETEARRERKEREDREREETRRREQIEKEVREQARVRQIHDAEGWRRVQAS